MELNKIYNEDCLVGMNDIPDKSIDMILCDLPYGTTKNKWDSIIDLDELWVQYNRIIKDNGAIVLFGSQPFTTKLISSNLSNFREELIWVKNKSGSGLRAKSRHLKTHEDIIVFSNSGKYTYNPEKWFITDKTFITQRKTLSIYGETNNNYGNIPSVRKKDDGSRFPISLLPYKIPITPAKSKQYSKDIDIGIHPTQKPVALVEYLVKTYANEGETVLDNCMGSGTTAVACMNTNRNYIGFELDKDYYELANERIINHKG